MATQVEIANRALSILGSARISAMNESSREATLVNSVYDDCRKAVIRMHPWLFARTRVQLVPSVVAPTTPAFDYTYFFDLPTDCLRLIQVEDGRADYQLEGRRILYSGDTLNLYYIKDVTTTTEYDSLFIEALAHYIAWTMCLALTQSSTMRDQIWRDLITSVMPKAKHVNATETPLRSLVTEEWELSKINAATGFVRDPMT